MRRALGTAALACCLLAPPARAEPVLLAAGVFQGSGTVSPGLTSLPSQVAWSFSGTLLGADDGGARTYACFLSGHGLADSVAEGAGAFDVTCVDDLWSPARELTAFVSYVRAAAEMTVFGPCLAGSFVLRYHDTNPSTSYDVAGALAYVATPGVTC